METMVLDRGGSTYLVNAARMVKDTDDVADFAVTSASDWTIEKSSPFVTWISGDYVEADKANSNGQYWTAADLSMSEYTIRHAPLNMLHKFRQPVGFFLATKTVKLERDAAAETQGSLKIRALSGLWSHIFQFEQVQVEAADEAGLLFYSMECRGTHLICAGDNGCGGTFDYMDYRNHCAHLLDRTSIRHIVNPTFRGGALVVPPVKPGWKHAHASLVSEAVMAEAATFAEQNEAQYQVLNENGADLSTSAWEQVMAMVVANSR